MDVNVPTVFSVSDFNSSYVSVAAVHFTFGTPSAAIGRSFPGCRKSSPQIMQTLPSGMAHGHGHHRNRSSPELMSNNLRNFVCSMCADFSRTAGADPTLSAGAKASKSGTFGTVDDGHTVHAGNRPAARIKSF
nr:hypothetical protein [Rhodococcus qingshengii]